MNLEEKLKAKSHSVEIKGGLVQMVFITDAFSICQEAVNEAKIEENEYWLKRFHGDYRRQETLDRIKELKEKL